MKILSCPSLDSSFPSGVWPPNLCSLEIGALKKPISEWGDQNFPASLVNLELWGDDESDEVRNFSEMSHLFPSSLTSLGILGFDNLESLSTGLQHLTSLQHLTIGYCENVNDLPETLLPSLLSLTTIHCPKLPERDINLRNFWWWNIHRDKCENRESSQLI
ncbi:hypothetical protein M8C21_011804 [Ambrosia artemisiifolia]|uniref:Uncharacterized protein n=1 Tax=Ambrosia artemisiifolia TaxID=4212 RepID=A0AAD5CHX2_AMBAR|nr:hypothetical protein M8C21_011804 [Ambrosia artemisiifolia]